MTDTNNDRDLTRTEFNEAVEALRGFPVDLADFVPVVSALDAVVEVVASLDGPRLAAALRHRGLHAEADAVEADGEAGE